MSGRLRRWGPWVIMLVVLAAALIIGSWPSGTPSVEQRSRALAATIKCPSCESQSVADSDTPAAHAIRDTITARLRQGQSTDQIRDYVVSRYGEGILLEPSSSGIGALVFIIPVVAVVVAVAAIAVRFRHWRSADSVSVSADDRALVDAARDRPAGPASP